MIVVSIKLSTLKVYVANHAHQIEYLPFFSSSGMFFSSSIRYSSSSSEEFISSSGLFSIFSAPRLLRLKWGTGHESTPPPPWSSWGWASILSSSLFWEWCSLPLDTGGLTHSASQICNFQNQWTDPLEPYSPPTFPPCWISEGGEAETAKRNRLGNAIYLPIQS